MKIKDLKKDTSVKLSKLSSKEHKTQPPARFTETSLIKELGEVRNIGRPSTFSTIVSIIQERGYVKKVKGQQLVPTFLGFTVVKLLTKKFPKYTDYDYTSKMESMLDDVSEGKVTRQDFLKNFWSGQKGFDKYVESLMNNIDWEEVKDFGTLDLGNGYSIKYNKFGAFLQDDNGKPDEKGYLPSAKLDEDAMAEDYLDPEYCSELIKNASQPRVSDELGKLEEGVYKGWVVTLRNGKYGDYLQAVNPDNPKGKPINQKLPEGLEKDSIKLEDVADLFKEVKLPRNLSEQFFVGQGKKGNYLGFKASAKSRKATFASLPSEFDPRTVTLEEVEKIWKESEEGKKNQAKNNVGKTFTKKK